MGSRDATSYATKVGLIEEGDTWMATIISRNKAVHAYDEAMENDIVKDVQTRFYPLCIAFNQQMQKQISKF